MVNLLFTILTLIIALIFVRYFAHYIVYLYAKFIRFVSNEKINIKLHPVTFKDILIMAMIYSIILSIIFKIVGII